MSIRCALGWHKWIPRVRRMAKPEMKWHVMLVVPSLFSGPPYLRPLTHLPKYAEHFRQVGEQCARCRRRKP